MSLFDTPKGERPHIALFGRTNVGKSSLINALTAQDIALVAATPGTTTDPVEKAMEILPLGPVLLIDTPGLDDTSELGRERIARAKRVLSHTDLVILVVTSLPLSPCERDILDQAAADKRPLLLVSNKCDAGDATNVPDTIDKLPLLPVSAKTGYHINELRETIAKRLLSEPPNHGPLVRDLVGPGECCLLVVPIDASAPKGRLILPQQQVVRDLLEGHALSLVVAPEELPGALTRITPRLVVCDSQVFDVVARATPTSIPLTSFSILMARYKGTLAAQLTGVRALARLKDHDRILMAEGCTHHRQCEDIGTVKIPRWLIAHTKKDLEFATSSGTSFPADLTPYALVVLCGGCMLNAQELRYRLACAQAQNVPVTNYGICIAAMRGILERSIAPFAQTAPEGTPC